VAFGMRAYIAGSNSAQHNQSLITAESIIYGIGFFGILESAYTLTIDRKIASGRADNNPFTQLSGNTRIVHVLLVLAVILGIVGTTDIYSSKASDVTQGKTLKIVSAVLFVVISICLFLRAIGNVQGDTSGTGKYAKRSTFGDQHGHHVLLIISAVLLIREVYLLGTVNNKSKQADEKLFYILEAVPELIAICLFTIPGLIPVPGAVVEQVLPSTYTPNQHAGGVYATGGSYQGGAQPYQPGAPNATGAPYAIGAPYQNEGSYASGGPYATGGTYATGNPQYAPPSYPVGRA